MKPSMPANQLASSHAPFAAEEFPRSSGDSKPPLHIPDHELIRKIGGGSYGEVWLARNVVGTFRAVKIVHRQTFERDEHFEREFKGIQKFEPISRTHEGLVDILQIGRNDAAGYFYYVMELADSSVPAIRNPCSQSGIETAAVTADSMKLLNTENWTVNTNRPRTLESDIKTRGPLPLSECISIGLALTAALEHLHKSGLVHRDIKPSNIIFVNGVPKLADIGLVAEAGEAKSLVGTVGYIPPEGPGTPRADIYSLGKVLYEISLGKDRQDFPQLPPDLPQHHDYAGLLELNEVILKACETDSRRRYQSAAQMQGDLAVLQSGLSLKRLRGIERRLVLLKRTGVMGGALLAITATGLLYQHMQTLRVQREKDIAERERRGTEQLLYAADVNLAQQALEAGNLVRANTLIEGHRPKSGSEDLRGFEWYYLKNLCHGDEAHTFRGHEQAVNGVAVSPDGKLLASCSEDGTIRLWDLPSKTNVDTLRGHRGAVNSIAFSPDGTRLASGGEDKTVRLWDLATRETVAQFTNHDAAVTSLAFTPDGRLLAVGTDGAGAKLWDIASGQVVHEFTAADGAANLVAVSPDGQCLAIGGEAPGVRLWKLSTFQPLAELFDRRGFTLGMAFSPDGKFLAATRSDGVVLWDIAGPRVVRKLKGHEREVLAVVFSPDGNIVASGSEDMTIRLLDFASGQLVRILKGHNQGVYSLAFSSDGQQLISGSLDHTLKVWNLSRKEDPDVLRGHADSVKCVTFSPDDRMLASSSLDGTVKLWDVSSGTNLATLTGHTAGVTGVEFSRDGATLFSCGLDKTIRFWNVATREQKAELQAEEKLACLALSPDGRTLAVGNGSWDQAKALCGVNFLDVASRRRLTRYVGAPGMILALSFSTDGKTLAIGRTGEESLELLETESKRSMFFSTSLGPLLAWSADSRTLAAPDLANLDFIGSLDIVTGRTVPHFQVPGGASRSLTLSPDGKTLAVFRATANIELCNVVTGRKVATLHGHDGFGFGLAFSHDGQTLASASNDRTVRLWRGPTNEPAVGQSELAVGR